jgi:tetratricopeptide (TPR) repeat protein
VLFFIIPLSLAVAALLIVTIVVWRKMSFLRKLTPEAHDMGDTWLHDMAPEVITKARGIHWRQYMHLVLVEFEKFLRRVRLAMSALDRASDRLVRKVRRVHQETAKQVQDIQEKQDEAVREEEKDLEELDMNDPDQLRQEEQRLIVAIAQHPKDVDLYSELARVYAKLGNLADAVEALQAAVKLDSENENFKKRLESAQKRLSAQSPKI